MSRSLAAAVFRADRLEDLAGALACIDTACASAGAGADESHDLRLAMEEVFTNVFRHGYAGAGGPLELHVDIDAERAVVQLLDRAPVFNPDQLAAPLLSADLDQRAIGGLGWHLVRQLMDEVSHAARPGGGNVYTLARHRIAAPRQD